jgi:hypothetical protein
MADRLEETVSHHDRKRPAGGYPIPDGGCHFIVDRQNKVLMTNPPQKNFKLQPKILEHTFIEVVRDYELSNIGANHQQPQTADRICGKQAYKAFLHHRRPAVRNEYLIIIQI